ncbi:MAG: hypothetical protein AAF900_00800 [Bacteroidota bacterium]
MNVNMSQLLLFFVIVVAPTAWIIKLDLQYTYNKHHPTAEKEVLTRKEREAKKYPPGERDTKMRNAIKAHRVAQIKSLLEGHDLTIAKSEQSKAYQRFTKGLYGGWDWELCKQLAPRLGLSFFWALFVNPFYFLSTYNAFRFLRFPLNSAGYGLTIFSYAMQFVGLDIQGGKKPFSKQLKENLAAIYWPCFPFANTLYMLYRIYTDIKAPSYLMMILASDKFTPQEKESLQELFYTKIAAGKNLNYKPSAMQTYGLICTQHNEAERIEDELLKRLEANLKRIDEENKLRGHAWIVYIWLPQLMYSALRTAIFYSGLSFTYIALPASSDDTYKVATYTDGISLNQDEYTKETPNNQKTIDEAKLMWKIVHLIWAACLHSGFASEYQFP